MAVNTMPEKRYQYIIDNNGTETELTTDPKGWDGHEIGFERSEDFGLNIQNVVPLSFSGAGRSLIKGVYESKGIFGQTKTIIKKRQNDWTYAPFYTYKHDYSTYKDNLRYAEISGIEDGLAKKISTYKDTEYEIDLPISKTFLDYTGANYTTTNQLQAKYGKLAEKTTIGEDMYVIGASRAVRAYNNKVAFTDGDGLPYETMTFRALETTSIEIDIFLKLTIEADAYLLESTPNPGTIKIYKHNASFDSEVLVTPTFSPSVTYPFVPSSTSTPSNNRVDVFDTTTKATLSIEEGQLYSFFYDADNKAYDEVSVKESSGCYISISNLVDNAYKNAKLEVFTYEWLIEQLLLKIDSTATFASTVTYPNVKEFLSCTPCFLNIGKTSGTGKVKTTLKDVLESFNKLKCIAIDITGSTMTISDRADAYPTNSSYGLITVNNIVVEHDSQHQYNKVTVGADTADREDDDPLIYPFICKKEFSVDNTIAENELDLVNNFMLDPYEIDKYIRTTTEKTDVKDECKFAVFATKDTYTLVDIQATQSSSNQISGDYPLIYTIYTDSTNELSNIIPYSPTTYIKFKVNLSVENADVSEWSIFADKYNSQNTLIERIELISRDTRNNVNEEYEFVFPYNEAYFVLSGEVVIDNATVNTTGIFEFQPVTVNDAIVDIFNKINTLYRDHTIVSGFIGDDATIYNIPLTPKRILDRWKKYLAISLVGATTKKLTYGTATIKNSALVSKCAYESANLEENTDLSLTGVTPIFLPTTISADTQEKLVTVADFETEKYKYFRFIDEKSGNEYQGWINTITFAVAKTESKQIILQAKEL